jgi:hypothetical protein
VPRAIETWAAALIALVACGAPTRHAPGRASAPAPLVHAAPPNLMDIVAVTADGHAAFTSDVDGNGRLWTTLDGSVEPVVVDLPIARAAAIARDDAGFHVAVVDDAGGIVVEAFDRDGRRTARATIAPDPVVRELVGIDAGILARRADHSLALVDWQGRPLGRVVADPGEQLVHVAGNGHTAVVAAARRDGARELRRIAVANAALAWGDATPNAGGDVVALSPSGDLTAYVLPQRSGEVVIADRRGAIRRTMIGTVTAFGFVDDDHVVAYSQDNITFIAKDGTVASRPLVGRGAEGHAFAAGVAVTAVDTDLAVSTLAGDQFVGYGVVAPATVAAGSGGTVMINAPDGAQLLDRDLAPIRGRGLVVDGHPASLVAHLAGDDWLVETAADERPDPALYAVHGSAAVELAPHTVDPVGLGVAFEPATNLVATTSSAGRRALRYDPDAHALRTDPALARHVDVPDHHVAMTPVDPRLSGGMQLVTVDASDTAVVRWYRDDAEHDLADSIRVASVVAVDDAGHAYAIDQSAKTIDIYDRTRTRLGTLPRRDPNSAVSVSRDRTRVAQMTARGLYVDDVTGKPVWHVGVVSWDRALWLDDGTLVVPTGTGLVRLDAATGAVVAMRCGWSFGRAGKPHGQHPVGQSMCELAQRGESPWPPTAARGNDDDDL